MNAIGPKTWLSELSHQRHGRAPPPVVPPVPGPNPVDDFRPAALPAPPSQVVVPRLAPDRAGLSAQALRQLELAADTVEALLRRQLARLPADQRSGAAKTLIACVGELLTDVPPEVQPALLEALSARLELGLAGHEPWAIADSAAAFETLGAFIDRFGERDNLANALGGVNELAEMLLTEQDKQNPAAIRKSWTSAHALYFELFPHGPHDLPEFRTRVSPGHDHLRKAPGEVPQARTAMRKARKGELQAADLRARRAIRALKRRLDRKPHLGNITLESALDRLLDRHPEGPKEIQTFVAELNNMLDWRGISLDGPAATALAGMIDQLSQSSLAGDGAAFLYRQLPTLFEEQGRERLIVAGKARDLPTFVEALYALSIPPRRGKPTPEPSEDELSLLRALSPEDGLRVALAAHHTFGGEQPEVHRLVVRGLVDAVRASNRPLGVHALLEQARTVGPLAQALAQGGRSVEEAVALAHAVRNRFGGLAREHHWRELLGILDASYPALGATAALEEGGPLQAALARLIPLEDGMRFFWQTLRAGKSFVGSAPEEQRSIVLVVASAVCDLCERRDQQRTAKLMFSNAFAEGAASDASAFADALRACEDLPGGLAVIASAWLSPEDRAWLSSKVSSATTVELRRAYQDAVYACCLAQRRELVSALREADLEDAVLQRTVRYLAAAFRQDAVDALEVDGFERALADGRDPVEGLEELAIERMMEKVGIADLPEEERSPEGVRALIDARREVAHLLEGFRRGPQADGIDGADCTRVFLAALEKVVRGRWPEARYQGEAADALLGALTGAQRRAWVEELVTDSGGPVDPALRASAQAEARSLMRGLSLALPIETGWVFDDEALQATRARRGVLLEQVRAAPKGSAEHRRLGAELRELRQELSVRELASGIDRVEDAEEILPALHGATRSLTQLDAPGCASAADRLCELAESLRGSLRRGRYAVDEDGLSPMIGSHLTGCLNPERGSRRWALASGLSDANTKMLRVYRDDRFVCRGYLRVWPVKTERYQGPALWLEAPRLDGGGTDEDLKLLVRHALRKGCAMGVPVMTNDLVRKTATSLLAEAREMGLSAEGEVDVRFEVREGSLPAWHSDNLLNRGYAAVKVARNAGDDGVWTLKQQVAVAALPK